MCRRFEFYNSEACETFGQDVTLRDCAMPTNGYFTTSYSRKERERGEVDDENKEAKSICNKQCLASTVCKGSRDGANNGHEYIFRLMYHKRQCQTSVTSASLCCFLVYDLLYFRGILHAIIGAFS
jgi:hypothetical protein